MKLRLLLGLCFAIALSRGAGAEPPPTALAFALAREAAAAAEERNYPEYLAKMEAAVALRPDYPRLLVTLAAALALSGRPEDAMVVLEKFAALGLHSPVDKNRAFAALGDRKDFKDVVKKLAANLQNVIGEGDVAFQIPETTGLIEGIAWREKTGQFFFGDVHHRCVWVRTNPAPGRKSSDDVQVQRFTAEDSPLLGVFGLAVDEERGVLWAANSAVSAMSGFTEAQQGAAGVAEIDLLSGEVKRVALVPADGRPHTIGDLALGPDGSVWLPDSGHTALWRLAPGAAQPEIFVESAEFISLQGIVVTPDGSAVLVADYPGGLLRIDTTTRVVSRLEPRPNTTLIGIDGLTRAPNGDLLAIQNGVRPNRVVRLTLDAGADNVVAFSVLESSHLNLVSPSLGCLGPRGDLFFIGNANWNHFDEPGATASSPRPVPIFRTKLAPDAPKRKR
jgi:sugar lactone lactonase YvrE